MPMLWKSILHKDKPGYSSNSKSQFEMMGSSRKGSRNVAHNQASNYNEAADSDENILITNGNSYVTTKVRGGDDVTDRGSAGGDSVGFRASLEDSRIYRTVEVHQYGER